MYFIYTITNVLNYKKYVGQTKDYNNRVKTHLQLLRRNKHHNIHLQNSFNLYGESVFIFDIIYSTSSITTIDTVEELLIPILGDYNISKKARGGDLISYHPNRSDIIVKMTNSLISRYANMTPEDKLKVCLRTRGKNNGMYGKKHSDETRRKMSENNCHKRDGYVNPNKGRVMSAETKKKLSDSKKGQKAWNKGLKMGPLSEATKRKLSLALMGKPCPTKRSVICEGVEYDSVKKAAEFYSITSAGMCVRLKSKKFTDFYYKDNL